MYQGIRDHDTFQANIEQGRNIVNKFIENFFIKNLMDESTNKMASFGFIEETKKQSYDENSEEQQKMSKSFY